MGKSVVMFGDSIMSWNKVLPFKNYGEPGFTTLDLLWKLEGNNDIIGDVAVLMIGINDILLDCSVQMIGENVTKISKLLGKKFERVIIISILPIWDKTKNNSILMVNKMLKGIQEISFLDIYDLFLGDSGEIDNQFTGDGVHLSGYGYEILHEKIQEALQ